MNDEVLKILLTESDVNLIMNALTFFASEFDNDGDGFTGALELHDDLLEQVARHDDPDWSIDTEPTDLEGRVFTIAEDDFIDAGIQARQMAKNHNAQTFGEFEVGTSKAADRRNERMMQGTASPVANDPIDW